MLKVLIAPDKFKGSLSAAAVCSAVTEAILKRKKDTLITSVPLADGGEGTQELLTGFYKASSMTLSVNGPLFSPVTASYSISSDGTTAIIEMAMASGLQLLDQKDRNPLYTTTYGTGELISDALNRGVDKIILGIGGSATNDAGIGMAAALGFQFLDAAGEILKPIGKNLVRLHSIKSDFLHPRLNKVKFITLCDVDNPLHGPEGAAFIYGPQKGAAKHDIQLLDDGLRHFENIIQTSFNAKVNFPGAGAAGGLGAGSSFFLNATLLKGIDYIIKITRLEEKIMAADLIITGEGKLDNQSLAGKVVVEVSRLANSFGKPVVAICGKCELTSEALKKTGIRQIISLVDDNTPPEKAIQDAYNLICQRIDTQLVF